MISQHPMKRILVDIRNYWDHERTPANVRENLRKVMECGTIALGAEVYASATESKAVFHTCKSRFCTSCGQRSTEAWQQEMQAVLPDIPYIGITLTMPVEFRTFFRENRGLLHCVPAMGASKGVVCWNFSPGPPFPFITQYGKRPGHVRKIELRRHSYPKLFQSTHGARISLLLQRPLSPRLIQHFLFLLFPLPMAPCKERRTATDPSHSHQSGH